MLGKTHLLYGSIAGLAVGSGDLKILGLTMLGSVISDIDHPNSMIGKNIPLIPNLLPHRGPTHSLIFLVVSALINLYFGIGVAVHLVLDMMTKSGIQILWPWKRDIRFPLARFVRTGGIFELSLQIAGVLILIYLIARVYFNIDLLTLITSWMQN